MLSDFASQYFCNKKRWQTCKFCMGSHNFLSWNSVLAWILMLDAPINRSSAEWSAFESRLSFPLKYTLSGAQGFWESETRLTFSILYWKAHFSLVALSKSSIAKPPRSHTKFWTDGSQFSATPCTLVGAIGASDLEPICWRWNHANIVLSYGLKTRGFAAVCPAIKHHKALNSVLEPIQDAKKCLV